MGQLRARYTTYTVYHAQSGLLTATVRRPHVLAWAPGYWSASRRPSRSHCILDNSIHDPLQLSHVFIHHGPGFALAAIDLVILTSILVFYTPVVLIPCQTVICHEKGAYSDDDKIIY